MRKLSLAFLLTAGIGYGALKAVPQKSVSSTLDLNVIAIENASASGEGVSWYCAVQPGGLCSYPTGGGNYNMVSDYVPFPHQ
jgi:hypothetical protein